MQIGGWGIVGIALFMIVAFAGLALLSAYMATPHMPRPLFHGWGEGSMGWGWLPQCESDAQNTYAYFDDQYNMLVITLVGEDLPGLVDIGDFRPRVAILLKGSPYELRVIAKRNCLLLIREDRKQHRFSLNAGEGRELFDTMCQSVYDSSVHESFLAILRCMYSGPEKQELSRFLEDE